jgi:hypothetical protein
MNDTVVNLNERRVKLKGAGTVAATGFYTFFNVLMSVVSWFEKKSRVSALISFSFASLNITAFALGHSSVLVLCITLMLGIPVFLISFFQWLSVRGLLELSEHKTQFQEMYAAYTESLDERIDVEETSSFFTKARLFFSFAQFAAKASYEAANVAFEMKGYVLSLIKLFNPVQLFLFGITIVGLWLQVVVAVCAAISFL